MNKKPVTKSGPVDLPELKRSVFTAYIIGDSPLIVHAWSKKARIEMLAKQMGQKLPRFPKSPVKDFLESIYRTDDGAYGFPASAMKKAMVVACTSMNKEITKIAAQQAFFVEAEQGHSQSAFAGLTTPMQLVRIHSPNPPAMREDGVRLNGKTADLRYRAEFQPWAMKVRIIYNDSVVTARTIAALIDTAGFAVGLGEWRQEKSGTYGQFRLADPNEIKQIEQWIAVGHKEPSLPDEKAFLEELNQAIRMFGEADSDTAEEFFGLQKREPSAHAKSLV